jgi:hypothetical protein
LHYFGANYDLYVAELSQEDDRWIAFGYTVLGSNPEGAEWGYTDLTELEAERTVTPQGLPLLIERDCWWGGPGCGQVAAAERGPTVRTIDHGSRAATHELTYSFPESRDQAEHDKVCGECAEGYTRRPTLKATARPLAS